MTLDRSRTGQLVASWLAVLVVSELPEVLFHLLGIPAPAGLVWVKMGFLGALLILCRVLPALRPLTSFAAVMLVFLAAIRGAAALGGLNLWKAAFGGSERSFTLSYLDVHLRDVGAAMAVLLALWVLLGDRKQFFLARGDLSAPVEPVRWLGIRPGGRWMEFIWIFGGIAAVAVLVPMLMGIRFEAGDLQKFIRYSPTVLLLAALNAFAEEVYFRLSLLGTVTAVVGRGQAQMMNVVLFGLAHYLAGSPPGIAGFLMTGFLAWVMGKCILETRGLLGAWLIHIMPDIVIFATYALLWKA